jgi:hypothetical protein
MASEKFEFELDAKGDFQSTGDIELPGPDEIEIEEELDDDDVDVEVVDDTPEQDRDKVGNVAPAPSEVTEEELASYSKDVQKRIKHTMRSYHDERRAKEAAVREREAAVAYAKQLLEKLKEQDGTVHKSREVALDQAKRNVVMEVEKAKAAYRAAYESGDPDAVTEAQDKLTEAKIKFDKVSNFKLPPVQSSQNTVKQPVQAPPAPADEKANKWAQENQWFGSNKRMTAFSLGVHQELVEEEGVDPRSDEYYKKLNTAIRKAFPDEFEDEPVARQKSPSVVAPATRSVAPKKITLSRSDVAIAKTLGVPLEQYAREKAALNRSN